MKMTLTWASLGRLGAVLAVLTAASCSSDNEPGNSDTGRISASVDLDSNAVTAHGRAGSRSDVSAADLSLTLTSADGSYNHTWNTVGDFPEDQEFKAGRYSLTAVYGNADAEGFEKPYYYGTTDLRVVANETTSVALTATLANAMVSVDYTDAFTGYMADYSAELQSKDITFAKGETRPAYVTPGEISLNVSVTKPNGKSATLNVANFTAEARHHYRITVDVNNGGAGDAVLTVIFDDQLNQEPLTIDLSDELFDAPAPTVTPSGFSDGETIEVVEGTSPNNELLCKIIGLAGLGRVNLTTESSFLHAHGWSVQAELTGASEAQKAAFADYGLVTRGIYGTPDKMAVIDFAGVARHIGYVEGDDNVTTFTVSATDLLGKVGESVSVSVRISPVTLKLSASSETSLKLGDRRVTFDLEYNGQNPASNITFEYLDSRSRSYAALNVLSIAESGAGHYKVVLETPDEVSSLDIRPRYVTGTVGETLHIERNVPLFTLDIDERDTYARSTTATLSCDEYDPAKMAGAAVWEIAGSVGSFASITPSAVDGASVHFDGLTPGTSYTLRATVGNKSAVIAFSTEAATQLPNSDMETWYRTAGKTDYWWIDYPGADTNAVWGTLNALTTSVGDGNTNMFRHKGTSYCAFSGTRPTGSGFEDRGISNGTANKEKAHAGNYAAVISTVGWGDNDGNGSTSTGKGCKNLTPGELYLGTYDSANSRANYSGMSFGSRPSAMTFYYYYCVKNSADYGYVSVSVTDTSGNVLAQAEKNLQAQAEYTQVTLPLTYGDKAAKAARIYVSFKSSANAACHSINTDNLSTPNFGNLSSGRFTGSELFVDDIKLTY